MFQQHSAYGISGHAAKTGGFYIRYGDIGGGAASNMGVLFRSGNTLGVQGTPLVALNLEKDNRTFGSTSALAADGFFSLISPSGNFDRDYNPLTVLGDGQTFAIRHGKAEAILDIREFGSASPTARLHILVLRIQVQTTPLFRATESLVTYSTESLVKRMETLIGARDSKTLMVRSQS